MTPACRGEENPTKATEEGVGRLDGRKEEWRVSTSSRKEEEPARD